MSPPQARKAQEGTADTAQALDLLLWGWMAKIFTSHTFWTSFNSRMLRRRVPVLKLGWVVTKRRCAVSAKRPQASAGVRKRPQASASVREWRNACC